MQLFSREEIHLFPSAELTRRNVKFVRDSDVK